MNNPIYNAALNYIEKGVSIIPCGKDKRPLIEWRQFQSTKATVSDLDAWMTKYPEMQIGIVTGAISGLLVVDIDDPQMDRSWLPDTAIIQTGSGGYHYYYSYTSKFGNKAGIREHVDIRGDGGFVIAPPSFNLKGQYKVIKPMNFQPFPIHLFEKTQMEKIMDYVPMKSDFEGFGQGQRNDGMARYIGHLLAKIHPSEWQTLAWKAAQEANMKNTPPLPERELMTTFQSIANKEKSSSTDRWYKSAEKEEKLQQACNLLIKTDYKQRYTWGTRGLDTALAIIKRGNFIVLGAKSSSGKTTFAFDMAQKNALLGHKVLFLSLEMDEKEVKDSIARNRARITIEEELDYKVPPEKQKNFEEKRAEIDAIKNLSFRGVRRGGGLKWDELLAMIYDFKDLDMIFIDNLDLIEGERNENDLDRQKRIVKQIMGFTSKFQIPIILIHHYRKQMGKDSGHASSMDDLSGSMKIVDGADRIVNITRNRDPEAKYPEKYKSKIYLQKGREYPDAIRDVFFIYGTFVDTPPPIEQYDPLAGETPRGYLEKMREEEIISKELEAQRKEQIAQAAMFGLQD